MQVKCKDQFEHYRLCTAVAKICVWHLKPCYTSVTSVPKNLKMPLCVGLIHAWTNFTHNIKYDPGEKLFGSHPNKACSISMGQLMSVHMWSYLGGRVLWVQEPQSFSDIPNLSPPVKVTPLSFFKKVWQVGKYGA